MLSQILYYKIQDYVSLRDNLREQVVEVLKRAGIEIPVEMLTYKSAYH